MLEGEQAKEKLNPDSYRLKTNNYKLKSEERVSLLQKKERRQPQLKRQELAKHATQFNPKKIASAQIVVLVWVTFAKECPALNANM